MTQFALQATADQLENEIRARRLFELPVSWADELVYPAYADLSLRNIPHTVAQMLGVPMPQSAPLRDAVWGGASPQGDIKRVVSFLMDGMGYLHLKMLIEEDEELRQIVADLTGGKGFVPMTSIAPSTTAVALSSLWTGGAPIQTGFFGTVVYLREIWQIASILSFSPVIGQHAPNALGAWGFPPASLIGIKGFAEHLTAHNIPTYILSDKKLWNTGLSHILHRGVTKGETHLGFNDFYPRLEDMLQATRGEQCYIGVYYPGVDTVAHEYGAHNRYTHHEIKTNLRALRDLLAQENIKDGQTLFLLTADHGHADAIHAFDMPHYPQLRDNILPHLVMGFSGECRLPIFHVRDGHVSAVEDAIQTHFPDAFTTIRSDVALQAGLFGIPEEGIYKETPFRLGDLIVIARPGVIMEDTSAVKLKLVSWHGGLDAWEMLTPLLWMRF